MFTEYGELSTELYGLTKPVGFEIDGDILFYLEQAKETTGLVLEAGVGTGRMLIPFLKAGVKMDGVDLSPFMLDKCRENLEKEKLVTDLFLQDLQQLDIPKKYDIIMMPTGSFALLPTREIMLNSLESFKKHLLPGGKIIIDLLLPRDFKKGESTTSVFSLTENSGIVFNSTSLEIDWEKQQTTELHRYEKWIDGKLTQTELSNFILSWYGIEEFTLILEKLGFVNIQHLWDYNKETTKHDTLTFIAETEK